MTSSVNCDKILLIDGRPVASLRVADTSAARRVGLLGTDSLDGALWITRCPSVHTFRMRYPIDVAFVNRAGTVVDIVSGMKPGRLGRIRFRSVAVIEAEAGCFMQWGLAIGVTLEASDN